MNIIESIKTLGFSEKEARAYLALLQIGKTTGYEVAVQTGLKRPTAYVVLEELVRKGAALHVQRARAKLYEARPPDEMFIKAEEKLRLSKTVLPELTAMQEKPDQKFRTSYYEGVPGIQAMTHVINQRMRGKEIVGFYGKVSHKADYLEPLFHETTEDRKRLGIQVRGVTPDDQSLNWYRDRLNQLDVTIKFLNTDDYSSKCSVEVGDDFIQFISMRYLQGVHIDNPDIAHQMRQIFEIVWQSRKEPTLKGAVSR